jgi:hypothetical protein
MSLLALEVAAVARMHAARSTAMKTKSKSKTTPSVKMRETKLQQLEAMLRQPSGATVTQLSALLEWQPHSVRGAMSNLKKKRGLAISAENVQGGERTYRIAH